MITCFIDHNISLSKESNQRLLELNINTKYIDTGNIPFDNQIQYLLTHTKINSSDIDKLENCKYIGIRAKNTDYIDSSLALKKGIKIKGLKQQHGTYSVAEHTLALILALAKNLIHLNSNTKNNKWQLNSPINTELNGKQIMIIGAGNVGKQLSTIVSALGMIPTLIGKNETQTQFEKTLKTTDIISIHASKNSDGTALLGSKQLKIIRDDAIIINTARGSALDYPSLINELKKGRFKGVGLDVYHKEPIIDDELLKFDRVIGTPHFAYYTKECLDKMNEELLDNLISEIKAHNNL